MSVVAEARYSGAKRTPRSEQFIPLTPEVSNASALRRHQVLSRGGEGRILFFGRKSTFGRESSVVL